MKHCRIVVFAILIFSFPLRSESQDTIREEQSYKNSITLDLGRFFWNEARFGYERFINENLWWILKIGFQYPTSESFENYTSAFGYGYEPNYNKVSTGIYLGTGCSYYFERLSDVYISVETYYNYAYYNHKYFIYTAGVSSDDKTTLESMKHSKAGFKILYGKKFRGLSIGKAAFEMDWFAGVGFQYRFRNVWEEGYYRRGVFYTNDPPLNVQYQHMYPTFHIGVIFGIPF